jgi:hypothetical protein
MASRPGAYSPEIATPIGSAQRWLSVYVTIGVLVVIVVIGFLLGINSALTSIDRSLGTTTDNVVNIGGDVNPLPGHIARINDTLVAIDTALKPIPGQADSIIGSLSSINGLVGNIDVSLKNTSGTLITALSGLREIDNVLEDINEARADGKGAQVIIGQVADINRVLVTAKSDTGNIEGDLATDEQRKGASFHVRRICNNIRPVATGCV